MADNFLEKHMREYEERKAKWMARKRHMRIKPQRQIDRPEDEAL